MELYLKFFGFLLQYHLSIDVHCSSNLKWNIIFYSVFTLLFYFLFFPSLSYLRLSLLITSPSLLSPSTDPQTLLSSLETHRRSAWAQPPQTRRYRPTFGHRPNPFWPLFSIFGVLVLCFGLCLCFRFVFRICVSSWVDLCFGHGFRCVVSTFG